MLLNISFDIIRPVYFSLAYLRSGISSVRRTLTQRYGYPRGVCAERRAHRGLLLRPTVCAPPSPTPSITDSPGDAVINRRINPRLTILKGGRRIFLNGYYGRLHSFAQAYGVFSDAIPFREIIQPAIYWPLLFIHI